MLIDIDPDLAKKVGVLREDSESEKEEEEDAPPKIRTDFEEQIETMVNKYLLHYDTNVK